MESVQDRILTSFQWSAGRSGDRGGNVLNGLLLHTKNLLLTENLLQDVHRLLLLLLLLLLRLRLKNRRLRKIQLLLQKLLRL